MREDACGDHGRKGFLLRLVHRRRPVDDATSGIAGEALAYLRGRSFELYRQQGQPIPAWAYLNTLAHAEAEALLRLALVAPDGGDEPTTWAAAVTTLAAELVQLGAGDWTRVRRIQLGPLSRLEDVLIADPLRALDPSTLTSLGQAYLRQHPSTLGG